MLNGSHCFGTMVLQWPTLLVQPFCEEEVLLVSAGFSLGSPASSTNPQTCRSELG